MTFSAIDAAAAGFDTFVIEEACRAIDRDASLAAAWTRMGQAGVRRLAGTAAALPEAP